MSPENPRAALIREATRLHRRYQSELIERYSVCPWAKHAHTDGRLRTHVVVDASCRPSALCAILDEWASDPRAEVGFIIAPRFDEGAAAFAAWTSEVAELRPNVFLTASFHPDAGDGASAIHFLRQTPDPTVQVVRRALLEEIRSEDPPHYADIFELDLRQLRPDQPPPRAVSATVLAHNERLLAREGRASLQAIVDDICRDRDETYARILPAL